MKKTSLLKMISFISLATVTLWAGNPLYEKTGKIDIIDHKAMVAGSKAPGKDIFHISLEDTGIITGHMCGCTTAAFIVTKNALSKLYPDTLPLRRGVNVAISTYNMDIIDAITYLTGTRYNRAETNYDFILDPSLQGKDNTVTIRFERKDNKKSVIAVIDRNKILNKEEAEVIQTIKPKVINHQATKSEIMQIAKTQREIVKKVITALPKGAIKYR